MTLIGDISPVTSIETLFQLFVILSGASFGAGIIGSFSEFLSNSDESGHSAFKTKLKKLARVYGLQAATISPSE
jgi:hypothetical protein